MASSSGRTARHGSPKAAEHDRRVDPGDHGVTLFRLPENEAYANLNTGVFDKNGIFWFTGETGIYGRLNPKSGDMTVFKSPRGRGTYGMTITPKGDVWYASLAAATSPKSMSRQAMRPWSSRRRPSQGARRVWSIPKAASGSANGTAAMSRITIPPMAPGRPGSCRDGAAHLCGLCRRKTRLADRFRSRRDRALRSRHGEIRRLPERHVRRQCAASRRQGGEVWRQIRHQSLS